VERLEPDEAKTIQGLIAAMRYVNEKTLADGGHAIRSVHAKTQGILEGYLRLARGEEPISADRPDYGRASNRVE
jgi:hypothetical protein